MAFFLLARDLLGAHTETWLLWYGLLFMAMVLFKPEGIAGIWSTMLDRLRARGERAPEAVAIETKEGAA